MNSVNLIGRLGADPELRYTASGKAVANFSIAVKGRAAESEWFDLVAWEKTAEILCQYVTKGQEVGITGRLSCRKWEDKEGNKRKAIEIQVSDLTLIGGKSEGSGGGAPRASDPPPRQARRAVECDPGDVPC